VPDDFEPASYKSLMIGTKALMEKEQNDKKAEAERAADEIKQAHIEATQKMQEGWESDASELVQSGAFPNEPKKLEAAKAEVYDYIESELKKGNVSPALTKPTRA
jgi:DNA-binding protein H-NS